MLSADALSQSAISALPSAGSTVTASFDFAGSCTFTITPDVVAHTQFSFTGSGTFGLAPGVISQYTINFDNSGTFGLRGGVLQQTEIDFASVSTFGLDPLVKKLAVFAFNFSGTFNFDPRISVDGYDNALVDSESEIESPKAELEDGLSTTRRPGALTFDYLTAYTLGPQTIGAADTGILGWAWYVRTEGTRILFARSNDGYTGWQDEDVLLNFSGVPINELDVAFEENGRIVVVAERSTGVSGGSEIWLYWYKPSLADFTFEKIDVGRTPRVVLDNPNDTSLADIQVAYMQDESGLVTRRQAEDYATLHTSVFPDSSGWYLEEFARNRGNRLVAILSKRSGDEYYLDRIESTLYPFYNNDKLTLSGSILPSSQLDTVAFYAPMDWEEVTLSGTIRSTSTLALILITPVMYDKDMLTMTGLPTTDSALVTVVLVNNLYDKDMISLGGSVLSTSTLAVVVITYVPYDKDTLSIGGSVLSTSKLELYP